MQPNTELSVMSVGCQRKKVTRTIAMPMNISSIPTFLTITALVKNRKTTEMKLRVVNTTIMAIMVGPLLSRDNSASTSGGIDGGGASKFIVLEEAVEQESDSELMGWVVHTRPTTFLRVQQVDGKYNWASLG
jgi:hypothetical protein